MTNEEKENLTWVLLTKTLLPSEAHIIRSAMEAHDIPCIVQDDHPSGLGVGIGIVNTRVFVPESHLEEAKNLMQELETKIP